MYSLIGNEGESRTSPCNYVAVILAGFQGPISMGSFSVSLMSSPFRVPLCIALLVYSVIMLIVLTMSETAFAMVLYFIAL